MKKTILKYLLFLIVIFNFTGCVQYVNGVIQIPDSSIVEKNAETKLYYKDTNNIVIRDDLINLAIFLNESQIKPSLYAKKATRNEDDHYFITFKDVDADFEKNSINKILNIKFSLDKSSNYIIADKKYTTKNEIYLDFMVIVQFLYESTRNNSELKDKIGVSWFIYLDAAALNDGILKITTKREASRKALAEYTEIAFKQAGYEVVDTPEKADKIIYFQFTRDYQESEIKKLQKEGKNINFGVVHAELANQSNIIETGMNLGAMSSGSSGTGVGIGIGIGLVFALIDAGIDHNIILPTFKITDVHDNKSYLYIPCTFAHLYTNIPFGSDRKAYYSNRKEYYDDLRRINEGNKSYKKIPLN